MNGVGNRIPTAEAFLRVCKEHVPMRLIENPNADEGNDMACPLGHRVREGEFLVLNRRTGKVFGETGPVPPTDIEARAE